MRSHSVTAELRPGLDAQRREVLQNDRKSRNFHSHRFMHILQYAKRTWSWQNLVCRQVHMHAKFQSSSSLHLPDGSQPGIHHDSVREQIPAAYGTGTGIHHIIIVFVGFTASSEVYLGGANFNGYYEWTDNSQWKMNYFFNSKKTILSRQILALSTINVASPSGYRGTLSNNTPSFPKKSLHSVIHSQRLSIIEAQGQSQPL